MSTEKFIRLNEGLSGYGSIYPSNYLDNKEIYDKAIKTYKYKSLFFWPKQAKEYYETNKGSMRGYDGPGYANKLVFDFDCEENNDKAREDVKVLIQRLINYEIGEENVTIDFSGNKGFHLEVLLDKDVDYIQIGDICKSIAQGLTTFDDSIYDISRKIRLRNSKHEKSNLYKIPLTVDEFFTLSIDEIKDLAKNKRDLPLSIVPISYDKLLTNIPAQQEETVVSQSVVVNIDPNETIRGLSNVDFTKCPQTMPRCVYALLQGVMVRGKGETEKVLFHLATYLRNNGRIKEAAKSELETVLKLNKKLYPESDNWNENNRLDYQVIDPVFDSKNTNFKLIPGKTGIAVDNEVIKYYCDHIVSDKPCCLHKAATSQAAIVSISQISDDFKKFAESFKTNVVKTGINLIDDNMKIVSSTTTLLIGATGSGKTTLALDIMEKANKNGFNTMFFSMDMYKNLIYMKLAQKITGYSQDQILNYYETHDHVRINEIREKIAQRYDKTFFDFSKTLTLEEMKDRVNRQQESTGKEIKLVVVDYASRIAGPHSDKHANATFNALKSVEVAEQTDSAWIYVAQVSRNVGDGSTPLLSKRVAKESGDWEETATNVITVWRPFMGMESRDDVMRMFLAKNRMGSEIQRPLWWNGAAGTVNDMNALEYQEYQAQREQEEREVQKNKKSTLSSFLGV